MSNKRIKDKDSGSERLTASVIKAVGLHLLVVILLFVSFSTAPTFEPAKPIVQATLVQLNSKSPATTQTEQRIAGEAERTAAQRHEAEELERQQQEQQKAQEAARAAEQQRQAEAAARAAEQKAAEQKAAEQKAAEERRQAEQVEKQKAEEARRAEAARKLAAEEAAKKKAAEEEARRKAAEEAKRKEEQARKQRAAEEAKRKAEAEARAEAERVARLKREQEEARAKALADLLAEETQYQRAQADQFGDEVAASYDDVIRRYVSSQWRRPPTARNGMMVEVRISMLPSGDITDAVVVRSSGDPGFDQSAIQAVRNVGRIPEMQQLSRENPAAFDRLYRQRNLRFKPEDLDF